MSDRPYDTQPSHDLSRRQGQKDVVTGVAIGLAFVGALLFVKELPSLRRYIRIERM